MSSALKQRHINSSVQDHLRVISYVAPTLFNGIEKSNDKSRDICSKLLQALCGICKVCDCASVEAAQIIVKCSSTLINPSPMATLCRDAADSVIDSLLQENDASSHALNTIAWLLVRRT